MGGGGRGWWGVGGGGCGGEGLGGWIPRIVQWFACPHLCSTCGYTRQAKQILIPWNLEFSNGFQIIISNKYDKPGGVSK